MTKVVSRKKINHLFYLVGYLSCALCSLVLFFLLGVIFWKGCGAINLAFFFRPARSFGAQGGILYQILGSILLVFTTAVLCFPLALGTALYKSEFLKSPFWQKLSDGLIYSLNGIPSILFGLFGLIFFVNLLHTGVSWFVGSLILAMMILPTVILSTYQAMRRIPQIYRESGLALGLDSWGVIWKVVLPQGIHGAITGLLIGLARAVGETAPIMFIATAFSGVDVPHSLAEPVSALPTHILLLAQQATDPQAIQNAWGAGFTLMGIVFFFSFLAMILRIKLHS